MSMRDNSYSDDEVFIGEMTLQEVKHTFSKHRQTITCIQSEQQEEDQSIEIIRIHSEPCLLTKENFIQDKHLPAPSSPPISPSKNFNICLSPESMLKLNLRNEVQLGCEEDNFLNIERMVTDMYVSSKNDSRDELNKTLEEIKCTVDNQPESCNGIINNHIDETKTCVNDNSKVIISDTTTAKPLNNSLKSDLNVDNNTQLPVMNNKNILTPRPPNTYISNIATPHQTKPTRLFKTPGPLSQTKGTPLKKPGMTTPYKYVSSPVAAYIKNCPQDPLCKEFKSKNTLPGKSFIPRPQKFFKTVVNKENLNLPPSAYKSAKKTILISTENKHSSAPWSRKVTSSLQKPVITKHVHRVDIKNPFKQQQQDTGKEQEHSFANLTVQRAEVSVCTQKPAICKP